MSVDVETVNEILNNVLEQSDEIETLEETDIVDVRSRGEKVLIEAESSRWIVGKVTEQLLDEGYFIRSRDKDPLTGNLGFFIVEIEETGEPEAVQMVRQVLDDSYYMQYESVDLDPDGDVRVKCDPNLLAPDTASNLQEAGFYTVAISDSSIYLREGDE